jgi:hypothetical protein
MENEHDNIENLDHNKAIEKIQKLVDHTNTCLFHNKLQPDACTNKTYGNTESRR